jgi:hypothetical protein
LAIPAGAAAPVAVVVLALDVGVDVAAGVVALLTVHAAIEATRTMTRMSGARKRMFREA